jgi:PAS domain S-box-containing protein
MEAQLKLPIPGLPLRTTLIYLLFGSLWVLLSDQLLSWFVFYNTQQAMYQTAKGWFFILVSGSLLYLLLHKDLAARKQAENALRESEARFRLIFEQNPAIMMLIEPDSGAIQDANQAAAAFYGYLPAELCRMNINDINQLNPDEVQAERLRALREERTFFNFQHRLSNGELRSVEVHSAPIQLGEETLLFSIVHDATERRKMQQELQDVQSQLRGIIESAMDAIISTDASQQIVLANPAAEQMFGYDAGGLVGKPLEMLLPKRYRQAHREYIQRFGRTGATTRSMHALGAVYGLRFSGEEFPAEASISQISIGSEKIYTVILRDITERKRAEDAVMLSQKRFQALIEHAPDGIALLSPDGRLRQVTPSAEWILGYTNQDILGQDPVLLTHPEDLFAMLELLDDLLRNPGKIARTEYRFKHRDGSWRWLHSTISNLTAEPGVNAIVFNYRDVTDQKQAEEQIRRQLQRLRALHDIDVAISSSFDMRVSLEVLLREVRRQLGVDAAAILLLHPEPLALEYAAGEGFSSTAIQDTRVPVGQGTAGRAVLEHRQIYLEDLSQLQSNFTRRDILQSDAFISYMVTPLITKGEVKGVLEIYHRSVLPTDSEWLDFLETLAGQAAIAIENAQLFESLHRSNIELEQRVLERTTELNKTNAELERANRAKDEFLANMSHELRTPLNSILGLSESLLEQRRGPLNEAQQNSLHIIESSGHHLLALINDILDLSKIEAGMFNLHLEPVPVDDFCRSCLALVKDHAVRKSITLKYTNDSRVTRVMADPRRLKQILINLLTNAVKFTPEHGRVHLRVHGDREQDIIQISVIDTGIGIAAGDLKRLFQPFVQLDSSLNRQYQGTGLGLALVQRLTDLHGGSVQVESEPGHGSRFTVNLSCKQEEIAKLEMQPPAPPLQILPPDVGTNADRVTSASPSLILLAEDNMANVLTIGEYLESHGFKIIVAHDGLEAITQTETYHPDLILMDIQMPVLSGLDAIVRLRQQLPFASTPIIALTALAMPGDRERCLQAGATEYLSKPVSLKLLVKTIESLLQHRKGKER